MIDIDLIYNIVAEKLYASPQSTWNNYTKLYEDLAFDNLDLWEVVMALEEEFSINILDEEAEHWQTLGDITRTVTSLKNF